MNCHWKRPLAAFSILCCLATARAETVVTLPAGAEESFSVLDSSSNVLVRVDESGSFTGTNVAFGTLGSNLVVTANNRPILTSVPGSSLDSLIVGSNTMLLASSASIVMGNSNTLYNTPYCSILGGKANLITYGNALQPYYSVIGGGYDNVITGAQNAVVSGGSQNTIYASYGAVAGGYDNTASNRYSFVAGGSYNMTAGSNSFAAGYHANALHDGSFVWGDRSSSLAIASSNDNEFVIRAAGGVRIASELGTNALTDRTFRFADNNVVAWARIPADGTLGNDHFGIRACTNTTQGTYLLELDVPMKSYTSLIPLASIEADAPPVGAAAARLIYVDQTVGASNFTVYITSGNFVPTNNDFMVLVTGR